MAIQKAIDTPYGVPAGYWNIGAVQEDFKGKGTQVTLYGYLDAEKRNAGATPLASVQVQLTGEQYVADANRAVLYGSILTLPEWLDAVTV